MASWSVLIVDDSAVIRKVICELFTREGDFEVCGEAENGQQAIDMAQQLKPALIVTDLSMPVMNGLDETRILRRLMPDIPIILYSAHIDSFVEKEALACRERSARGGRVGSDPEVGGRRPADRPLARTPARPCGLTISGSSRESRDGRVSAAAAFPPHPPAILSPPDALHLSPHPCRVPAGG
jgi:CheY-like chemotaxis protein